MAVCSNCQAEQPSSDLTSCILCGYPIEKDSDAEAVRTDDESMDFVVTEANGDSRPFVGGQNEGHKGPDDDLSIETTTDLMQQEAQRDSDDASADTGMMDFANRPIGDSSPPPPPAADYQDTQPAPVSQEERPAEEMETTEVTPSGSVKKLSEEDIKKIEQNLYGSNSYLKDQDKVDLKRKLDSLEKKSQPDAAAASAIRRQLAEPTQSTGQPSQAKSRASRKGTGIAYFYKSFIQITGQHSLIANDVITINNREYLLRPKKLKTPYLIGGAAVLFTVFLIVLASALAPGADTGQGRLLGVVLDEYDQPYLQGATIYIAEKDKSVESDQRGFFEAGMFPVGTYTVEYVVDGGVIGSEQVTVTDDEVRMVFLRPQPFEEAATEVEHKPSKPIASTEVRQPSSEPTPKAEPLKQTSPTTTTSSSTKSTSKKSSSNPYGKVTLKANVQNARLELDGSVMGAGNLTYSKIKTGRHRYRVSADGYQPAEGKLTVESGRTHQLAVTLKPLQQAQKAQKFGSDDYYYSGTTALREGDYQTAVSDLTNAIDAKPSYPEAYFSRAQAYNELKVFDKAYDDFIRAAEIYQMRKEYGNAIQCYSTAIELDDRVITAYLGRGNLYLKKGEELAAIADFDKARQIDKRSFQAYYGLGEARFKQQQYKKAIDHFKDARSVNENDPLVYQYLMLSYMAIAKYKDVKKTYDKFADIATEQQMNRFKNDQKYSAVLRVIESQ